MKLYEMGIWFYENPVTWLEAHEITKIKNHQNGKRKYYFRRKGNLRDTSVDEMQLDRMRTMFPRIGDGDMHNRIYVVANDRDEAMQKIRDIVARYSLALTLKCSK